MRILDLILKDLLQIGRDKRSLLFLALMPIAFTLFMGFAYKSGSPKASADVRLPLAWVNLDPGGAQAQELYNILSESDALRLVEMPPAQATEALRKGEIAGTLEVPAGYSAQTEMGGSPQLTLITDTSTPQGQSLYQTLRASVTHVMSAVEIARLSAEIAGSQAEFQPAFAEAAQEWDAVRLAQRDNPLVKVEVAIAEPEQAWYGDSSYNQASPGILVQFAIFGLVSSGQILVQERKYCTLQRMLTTSMPAWQILAGHALAIFAVVFFQELLLVIFGQAVLGVNYAREPLAVLVISFGLGVWVAAAGLLIGTLAKDDSQVVLFSLLAMFIFSALGGTWFPLESSSGVFATVGRLLPSAWAMTGYQNILIRGLGLASTGLPVLIMSAYALGLFALAVWRFNKASSTQTP